MVLAAAAVLAPAEARAQTGDERWAPFVGCWDLEVQRRPGSRQTPGADASSSVPEPRSARVCVEPAGLGVVLRTLVADQPALSQTIIADASPRPIVDGSCRGTEQAEWSKDGQRLFSRASLTCPGQPERTVSGLVLFATPDTWIDIQAVTVSGRESVRVRHYRREGAPAGTRRPAIGSRMAVDDVVEASGKVTAGALEAALIESRARFPLSGGTLIALDDAGVPDSVTDLMVALSYPQSFVVERTSRDDRLTSVDSFGYAGFYGVDNGFLPFSSGAGYGGYYDSAYYYAPFGYWYLSSYPGLFGGYPGSIVGVDGGGGGGTSEPAVEAGRVINGRGYTRVLTTRDAEAQSAAAAEGSVRAAGERGTVSRRGYVDGGATSSGTSAPASSGGSSGTSSGSSGDSGRTAVPR
jgi:hypothetical protein